ncbi:MAG: hypothetical protein H0T78_05970, partial [Longispora sp.]|nr:hypothetical protein [Longispora sp. (in: high G+C Gram-positive bacteria)]
LAYVTYVQASRWCLTGDTSGRQSEVTVNTSGEKVCRVNKAGRGGTALDVPMPSALPLGFLVVITALGAGVGGLSLYTQRSQKATGTVQHNLHA